MLITTAISKFVVLLVIMYCRTLSVQGMGITSELYYNIPLPLIIEMSVVPAIVRLVFHYCQLWTNIWLMCGPLIVKEN